MDESLAYLLKIIFNDSKKIYPSTKLNIINQFENSGINNSKYLIAQKVNAAFLILLTEENDEYIKKALKFLLNVYKKEQWNKLIRFYIEGLLEIIKEIDAYKNVNRSLLDNINRFANELKNATEPIEHKEFYRQLQKIFFPEGAELWDEYRWAEQLENLRKKRMVTITKLNPNPITQPAKEILFTSNILATIPINAKGIAKLKIDEKFKEKLLRIINEKQKYWYDHPIPVGIQPEQNEVIYGLRGLNEMVRFEKEQGNIEKNDKISCVLSISTTHDGLHDFIREYFESELRNNVRLEHLDVYMFTEGDTRKIVKEVLEPLAELFLPEKESELLIDVFGVDGEYGRHYTFLKAIAAFWQVFINRDIRATFKIDLDQVFPQEELVKQTGHSALEHFKTKLWGAKAIDYWGNEIELGLIAGSLVNLNDISKSLFYPDVQLPTPFIPQADEIIFCSKLTQAFSTQAEMMTRYNSETIDGKRKAIQRIHVTGGTTGILINSLRRYRPFTPSIIGRAEDQAFLFSVLYDKKPYLRYLHKPGLIMRHDKNNFAQDAINAAETGKIVGDYLRILLFSKYAQSLPWSVSKIKEQVDPFTGCFISLIPVTISLLRFATKVALLFEDQEITKAYEFQKMGSERIGKILNFFNDKSNYLKEIYQKEKIAWGIYYDILDMAEKALKENDEKVLTLQKRAVSIVKNCKIKLQDGLL